MLRAISGRIVVVLVLLATVVGTVGAQTESATNPAAQRAFAEGLEWLHSFEYEQALAAFRAAQTLDPDFAMAVWGEAICYQQFLWGNEDPMAARAILTRYGATPDARLERARTDRERRWLRALDTLFGPGDRPARLAAFAEDMRSIAAADPTDPDAAAFQGLALMATASRGLAGAHHVAGADTPQLAGSGIQARAASVFTDVLRTHPRHPGALHYLIHAYDDPAHAALAVEAARTYAEVAPASSHARHMAAHIFVQLGEWAEAAKADEGAFAASEAMVAQKGLPATMKDFHALSWLVYEYLQLGRFEAARTALARLSTVATETQEPSLLSLTATLRARIGVEAGDWEQLRGPDYVNYDELFGVGLSAVARGDSALAERARLRLAEMATQDRYRARHPLLEIMSRALSAQLRFATGDTNGALAVLREAVEIERGLPAAIGPPALIKPAYELLGELELAAGNARESAAVFQTGLATTRNRSASVLGRARAAVRQGDRDTARREYAQFLDNWRAADASRPELAEARAVLAGGGASVSSTAWWILVPVAGAAAAAVVIARRRRPATVPGGATAPSVDRSRVSRKPARRRRSPR